MKVKSLGLLVTLIAGMSLVSGCGDKPRDFAKQKLEIKKEMTKYLEKVKSDDDAEKYAKKLDKLAEKRDKLLEKEKDYYEKIEDKYKDKNKDLDKRIKKALENIVEDDDRLKELQEELTDLGLFISPDEVQAQMESMRMSDFL